MLTSTWTRARQALAALATLASITCSSLAHEFWIKPSLFSPAAGSPIDVQLFVGDGFPGEALGRNGPKIITFAAFGPNGQLPIPGVNGRDPAGTIALDAPGAYLLAFRNSPSSLELEAQKFEEYLAYEGLDHVIKLRADRGQSSAPGKERYSRCAKSLVRVGSDSTGFDRVVGLPFELVPVNDPLALKPAGAASAVSGAASHDDPATLRVRALHDGKPAVGVKVSARCPADPKFVVSAKADEQGLVSITFPKPGMWLVSSVTMISAPQDSGVDWESFWASYTFEIPSTPVAHAAGPTQASTPPKDATR